ncbi:TlpA family protein disulfide reductase [Shewanella sp. WXL01]|uniref:TlpA family protein disulfide reductase n=1 Tax=Shewanella sp. WXL01 TaxID=2709721 RepID=UPI0014384E64|nr:TlpA disulfide reductase family protein [Shewanella sp. WXL01]NKF51120.1 TlpA family protein disulfide reductase [Shewanella sp. WXL01]
MPNYIKLTLLILVVSFSALIGLSKHAQSAASNGTKAPDFQLANAEGEIVSLMQFKGRPMVIHFWATWCPYCKKLQPGLEQLRLQHKDTDLVMLGISIREDKGAQPAKVLSDRGIEFMTLLEGEEVADTYEVRGTPTTVFINRDGEIIWKTNISDPNDPNLAKAVEFLLRE